MTGYNLPENVSSTDPEAPWNDPKEVEEIKELRVRIRLRGVLDIKLKAPADLDFTDQKRLIDLLNDPDLVDFPSNFPLWSLTLGEFLEKGDPDISGEDWQWFELKENSRFPDAAQIYIETVEET